MKLTDIFKFKLFERTDPVDMETVNENFESVEKIFDGLTAEDVGALPTSGGILTGPLNIHGMAGEQPLKVSGIVGSDGVGNDDVLYLQLGVNKELILGNEGKYSFSADGGQYTGNAASATKAKQDGNGNVIADTYLTKSSVVNNNTTTEAGYALDARQANPNVEGSLGAQISALNSGLMNLIDFTSDKTSNTTRYCARFSGGLQICFGIFSNLQAACNKTSGSGYYGWNSDENGLTAFVQPFFNIPVVTVSILGGNSMCIRKVNATASAITLLEYMSTEPRNLATTVFHYIAIGRWK